MRKLTFGILGVVAVAASVVVLRQPRQVQRDGVDDARTVPAGERVAGHISLERIRELGY